MKNLFVNRLFLLILINFSIGLIAFLADAGCNNPLSITYSPPKFNESYNEIRYPGNEYSDVVFAHKAHSDRYNSECIKCHNCVNTSGNDNWNCRSCHNSSGTESICGLVDADHSCTYVHCYKCHELVRDNPGHTGSTDCIYCHRGGNTGAPLTVNPVLEKLNDTTAKLTFSKVLNQVSAELESNYTIGGTGGLAGNPANAVQKNNVEVELTTGDMSGLASGQTVTVTITVSGGVTALDGDEISGSNIATYTQP